MNSRAVSMTAYFRILLEDLDIEGALSTVGMEMPRCREARYATTHDSHPFGRPRCVIKDGAVLLWTGNHRIDMHVVGVSAIFRLEVGRKKNVRPEQEVVMMSQSITGICTVFGMRVEQASKCAAADRPTETDMTRAAAARLHVPISRTDSTRLDTYRTAPIHSISDEKI